MTVGSQRNAKSIAGRLQIRIVRHRSGWSDAGDPPAGSHEPNIAVGSRDDVHSGVERQGVFRDCS